MSLPSVRSETALRSCAVLELKLFQAFHLLDLQPTKFLAPAIVGHFAHADLADRIRYALSLRRQNINLLQPCNASLPSWPS
jgi:hypothetical protein